MVYIETRGWFIPRAAVQGLQCREVVIAAMETFIYHDWVAVELDLEYLKDRYIYGFGLAYFVIGMFLVDKMSPLTPTATFAPGVFVVSIILALISRMVLRRIQERDDEN